MGYFNIANLDQNWSFVIGSGESGVGCRVSDQKIAFKEALGFDDDRDG